MSEKDMTIWETDLHYCEGDWCQHKFVDGEVVYVSTFVYPGGESDIIVHCKEHAPEYATPYIIKLLNIPTSGGSADK